MSVYVYAITKDSHPLDLNGVKGVGESPAELRTVHSGSLCAVVSEAPEELSVSRRDLEAHHGVLGHLWADGTILPLSFGFVAQDEDAVRTVLEERAEQFSQRLEEFTGRAEFNIKGLYDQDALLRAILETSEQARALNEATREGGGTYEDRLALGELVAQEVQTRQDAIAAEVLTALRPLAASEKVAEPSQQYFVNASFLVDSERADEFTRTAQELAERYGKDVELRLRGPLPPYSFA
ncbi:GvpL/GvpF family gas vesicle protein [Streptantibioticus rubrisoli]|uniref:GvpL/GvpF family gas vesicle protein n=1 Tax=Streptantibioticus rubrisoli TaxID=1387313 RepID=A0ABT1PFV4_9ACTN|nr:GvpL/GvpF family gas vesicle protein [Streptantibioticus rubrisoli]MCQ4044245.1 GvpL/GvpF family gas vesicle protein [Streptantibioticus rubrisoli]